MKQIDTHRLPSDRCIVFDGDDTTRVYARTTEMAFGPYGRGPVESPPEPMHPADRIVMWASAVAAVSIVGFVAAGWLP